MHRAQRFVGLAVIVLAGCGASDPGNLEGADSASQISLNSHVIDTRAPLPEIPASLRVRPFDAEAERVMLVKFPGPITAEQDGALRGVASQVYAYLPQYSYLVAMPPGARRGEGLARIGASWWGPYHPFYKISRGVSAIEASEPQKAEAGGAAGKKIVMVQVYPDADLDRVLSALRALGVKDIAAWERGARFSRIRLLLTPAEIAARREDLARMAEVFWIDIEPRKALLNDTTIWVGQSGLNGGQQTPVFSKGIYGQGQIVGILDTGIDTDMCYFRDTMLGLPPQNPCNGGTLVDMNQRKVIGVDFLWSQECQGGIQDNEWDTQDHGSHVAGTVAGDNFLKPLLHDPGDGMAPGAKLVIQDGGYAVDPCADLPGLSCPVVDLKPIFQQAYTQGARIHTNSWGDQEDNPVQNNYTAACEDVDEFMWNHKDFLLIFAAGNSGPGVGSVGSPATAKSTVAVGATRHDLNAGVMAGFSSCGPTDDGRIKPEVTVPGVNIVSANSDNNVGIGSHNCNTRTMSGTSMAAPGAAGFTALIRQYYTDGWYPSGNASAADGFTPSAALLRATLVNSGEPMTDSLVPSNCQGWGRVLLENVLYFAPEPRRLWVDDDTTGFPLGSVNETRVSSYTVHASPSAPLKVTLAWTDFPSTPAATPHLVNDLDLEVTGPSGTYLGNVFAAGESTTGGSADRLNTLEQVIVKTPPPGDYTVTVRSINVPSGPQPFALVVTGNASKAGTLGAICDGAAACASGFCVDGVCCDTACDAGACDACAVAAGAAVDGVCRLLTGTACEDGDACSVGDTCQAGVCVAGPPVVCALPDDCHEAGICNSAKGACEYLAKADGTGCEDGSACTQGDSCQAGVCVAGAEVVCAAVDGCHEAGSCDPGTGVCSAPLKADGALCEDGDGCTKGDACQGGVCVGGAPVVCAAADDCHEAGSCDPGTGECSSVAKADGAPCPAGVCMGGVCGAVAGSSGSGSGSGGAGGAGAGTGAVSSSGAAGGQGGGDGPVVVVGGGCGCGVAGAPAGGGLGVGVGVGLLLGFRRRRKLR